MVEDGGLYRLSAVGEGDVTVVSTYASLEQGGMPFPVVEGVATMNVSALILNPAMLMASIVMYEADVGMAEVNTAGLLPDGELL